MELGLTGKKALITGAGRGLGKKIAQDLAEEGTIVCLISRTESELKAVCDEINSKRSNSAIYRVFDLSSGNYAELKKSIVDEIGNIDILVSNAAKQTYPKKISFMEEADWHKTIETDLNPTFHLVRSFIEDMKSNKWGRVLIIGSLSAMVGAGGYPAYCTVKAGLEGLIKNLAVDYSKYGITSNIVSPGFIKTERFEKNAPKELVEKFAQVTSVKRLANPEDISSVVTFLASEKAAYLTGVNIPVCGGLNLGNLW